MLFFSLSSLRSLISVFCCFHFLLYSVFVVRYHQPVYLNSYLIFAFNSRGTRILVVIFNYNTLFFAQRLIKTQKKKIKTVFLNWNKFWNIRNKSNSLELIVKKKKKKKKRLRTFITIIFQIKFCWILFQHTHARCNFRLDILGKNNSRNKKKFLHKSRFGSLIAWVSFVRHTKMREIVHLQAGQCGNQIGAKVCMEFLILLFFSLNLCVSIEWIKIQRKIHWRLMFSNWFCFFLTSMRSLSIFSGNKNAITRHF